MVLIYVCVAAGEKESQSMADAPKCFCHVTNISIWGEACVSEDRFVNGNKNLLTFEKL